MNYSRGGSITLPLDVLVDGLHIMILQVATGLETAIVLSLLHCNLRSLNNTPLGLAVPWAIGLDLLVAWLTNEQRVDGLKRQSCSFWE